jgi:uncharacterized phiE125 gp8 family phage protein
MGPVLKTAPAVEAVELGDAKDHLRVAFSDDDRYISDLISTARRYAEDLQRRALITQTWTLWLDRFPSGDSIELPSPPLQSVTHLKYTDSDDSESTFSADDYIVDTASTPGNIVLAYGSSWPTVTLKPVNAIEIEFVAGYGAYPLAVPFETRAGILLLVSHWYEHREPIVLEGTPARIPLSASDLLGKDRVFSL